MIICINHSAGFFFSVYTELYLFSSTQKLLSAIFFQKKKSNFLDFSNHKTRFSILNTPKYSNSTCGSRDFSCWVTGKCVSLMKVHEFPVIG